jgi:uncharacterized protein YoxC
MNESKNSKKLLDEINFKRQALNDAFVSEGLSEHTRELNKEMDQLINKYYRLIRKEKNKK